jgi:regulator of replication initiation timing
MKLMALFKPLEKLITEHGSATILRDHVSLMKAQTSILEKENKALKQENADLKIENNKLRKIIDNCEKENEKISHTSSELRKKITQIAPPMKRKRNWVTDY